MSIRFLKASGSRKRQRSNSFHVESLEDRRLLAGDLVAQWSADDLSLDSGAVVESWIDSVNTIEAVRQNGDPTFLANGFGGRGFIHFDATEASENLRIRTNDSPLNGANDFSVTVAFTTSADATGGTENWFSNTGIIDANTAGFSSGWGLSINAAGQLGTGLGGGFGVPVDNVYSTETGLNNHDLHIATVTRSGGELSIFVDDGAPTTLSGSNAGARSGVDLVIGSTLNSFHGFTGDIGEVRIYDGQLSAGEVGTVHSEIDSYYNNETPLAVDDSYAVNEDQFFFVTAAEGVLANDSDAEGDAMSVELAAEPSNGTLSLQPDGSFVYTPRADYFGIDLFSYQISDTRAAARLGVVTLNIAPAYDPASGVADNYKTEPNGTLNIPALVGVLANDTNIDQATLSAVLADDVGDGQLTLNSDGSFTYSPQGFSGVASFTYRVDDGTNQSEPTTVSIVVNTPPETVGDTYGVDEDSALQVNAANGVLANDVDADGNTLTAELVSDVTNGTLAFAADGSFTYTPNDEFSGADSFSYRITDGVDGSSSNGTVNISVATVNDAPIGNSDSYFALPGESLDVPAEFGVLANDTDVDSPNLTATLLQTTQNGTLTFNADGGFAYSSNDGFEGEDAFSYRVSDGTSNSDVTVTLQIVDRPVMINEIMTSNSDTLETQLRTSRNDDFEGETFSP
ncbi:Ig-like domain-containing protein, partial [Planctomycetota bacterium]